MKHHSLFRFSALVFLFAVLLSLSCAAEEEGPAPEQPRNPIMSISIHPKNSNDNELVWQDDRSDNGVELVASQKLVDSEKPTTDTGLVWKWSIIEGGNIISLSSSERESIATVFAKEPGEAKIKVEMCRDSGAVLFDEFKVTVSGVKLIPKWSGDLFAGMDGTFDVQLFGNAKIAKEAYWNSDNTGVATVSGTLESGKVETFSGGSSAYITLNVRSAATDGNQVSYTAGYTVDVKENIAKDDITGSITAGDVYDFSAIASQFNSRCNTQLGRSLSYITSVSVPTNQGTLFYQFISDTNHSGGGVAPGNKYYYTNPPIGALSLQNLSFQPSFDFTGVATISYTGFDAQGHSFDGYIKLNIQSRNTISYTTDNETPLVFRADDFVSISKRQTGLDLRSVSFDQPSASVGSLYYNYAASGQYAVRLSPSEKYYPNNTPSIDLVTFVPQTGYTGKTNLTYRWIDAAGGSHTDTVALRVTKPSSAISSADVSYSGRTGSRILFHVSDFREACSDTIGGTLSYVRFTLPSASNGTLYYNYASSSSAEVSPSANYYSTASNGRRLIADISFIPAPAFNGTVTIPYTAYNTNDASFSGRVLLTYSETGVSSTVEYSGPVGAYIDFASGDFSAICTDKLGERLNYISFTSLPPASSGTLYYNYGASNSSKVSANTAYYRTGGTRQINSVSFVPAANFSGTVTIPFTGTASGGDTFKGMVAITVGAKSPAVTPQTSVLTNIRYTGYTAPIPMKLSDFQSYCLAKTGRELAHVQFTALPEATKGRLALNYVSAQSPGTPVLTSLMCHATSGYPLLSSVSFVPVGGTMGTAYASFVATDTAGTSFSGTVQFDLSTDYAPFPFVDLQGYDWARNAIEYLWRNQVVNGITANTYGPSRNITRGAFILMLSRAFKLTGTGSTDSGFSDVPRTSVYAQAITAARELNIAQGSNGKFQPQASLTRQQAMVLLYRAMQAAGRRVSAPDASALSAFSDSKQVASYATDAMSSMVRAGILQGSSGKLNPSAPLTRAQMAAILYRALTY